MRKIPANSPMTMVEWVQASSVKGYRNADDTRGWAQKESGRSIRPGRVYYVSSVVGWERSTAAGRQRRLRLAVAGRTTAATAAGRPSQIAAHLGDLAAEFGQA